MQRRLVEQAVLQLRQRLQPFRVHAPVEPPLERCVARTRGSRLRIGV